MKYIEKSGERLVYGGDLPTYFVSDIMDEDIVCPFGIDDRKAILADDFTCISDGEIMGTVSKEIIEKMPKVKIKFTFRPWSVNDCVRPVKGKYFAKDSKEN